MKTSSATLALLFLLTSCSSQASTDPAATATPEAPASSKPAESSALGSAPVSFADSEGGSRLEPGTYVLNYSTIAGPEAFPTLAFTFTLPAGWDRVVIDGLAWNDKGMRLGFAIVDNLFVDPCDPVLGLRDPPVGASVDDLATALASLPGVSITETEFDRYFGFPGVHLVLASTTDPLACPREEARLAHTLGFPGFIAAMGAGEHHELWILQVEGTRVVIHSASSAEAAADARAELQTVIDSIEIEA